MLLTPSCLLKKDGQGETRIELRKDGTFELKWSWPGESKNAKGDYVREEGAKIVKLTVKTATSSGIHGKPAPFAGELTYDLAEFEVDAGESKSEQPPALPAPPAPPAPAAQPTPTAPPAAVPETGEVFIQKEGKGETRI